MKKCCLIFTVLVLMQGFATRLPAQENFIPIAVVAARQQNIPESVNTQIENKLHQVILLNGLGATDYFGRFVLTASIVPVSKDIIAGPPKVFSENLDITFYIVDNISKKIYSSTIISAKAVDASEEKVLNKAIKSINARSAQMEAFINKGRERIIDYYSNNADEIIASAKMLARTKNFEEAFYELSAIPEACGPSYAKALAVASDIYQEYVDHIGEQNLAKARTIWVSRQDAESAAEAAEYLSRILPDAKCYTKAEILCQEIKMKILDEWKFELTRYKDDVSLEKARIEAWKQVGVAYGKNMKSVEYNISWLIK